MTLEQCAHDIGIAFATCKMNSCDNSADDKVSLQTQFTYFITDYCFASSEVISGNAEISSLLKD